MREWKSALPAESGALTEALSDPNYRTEAVAIIRTLVDKIVLTSADIDGKKTMAIDLHGALAGILSLASNAKSRSRRATLA